MIPKFRVWDIEQSTMYDENDLLSITFYQEEIYVEVDTGPFEDNYEVLSFELMQSTGLKDKNGAEIYEGDIVEYKYPYDKRVKSLGDIVWSSDKACFAINMQESTEKYELYKITAGNYLKVVGNIFQHPHLLEADSHE